MSKLLTFLAVAFLARILGPASYGYVEFTGAVMMCASLLVDQGFGPYGAREIARSPDRTAALVSEIVLARVILAIFSYGVIVVLALGLGRPPAVTQLLLIYGLSVLVAPLLLQWVFQGHQRMQTVAAMQLIRQAVFAGVVFAFVRSAEQLWVVGAAELAGITGAAAFGLQRFDRQFHVPVLGSGGITSRLFREGVPIGLSQLFWMMRVFGATALLGVLAIAEDLGFFGAAMRIYVAMHAFVWLYFFNLLPSLAVAWRDEDGGFGRLTGRSLRLVAWTAACLGMSWIGLAPHVSVIVFGGDFAPAGPVLQWFAVVWMLAALSGHYRFGLIATGRQQMEMYASAIGASLAVVLVPAGYLAGGPSGAAAGLVGAEVGVLLASWLWARSELKLTDHSRLLLRPLVAVGISGAILTVSALPYLVRVAGAPLLIAFMAVSVDGEVRGSCRDLWALLPWNRPGPDTEVRTAVR